MGAIEVGGRVADLQPPGKFMAKVKLALGTSWFTVQSLSCCVTPIPVSTKPERKMK